LVTLDKQLAFPDDIIYNCCDVMFVSKLIDVVSDSDGWPRLIRWSDDEIKVVKTLNSWQDWGFAKGVQKKNWRARRHRNYFQVECEDQKIYEIYLDRQDLENKAWYLYRVFDKTDIAVEETG